MAFLIKPSRNPEIDLLNAEFNYIGLDEENTEIPEIKFRIEDSYSLKDFDEEKVYIEVKRKVFYEPAVLYNITVNLRVGFYINKENKEKTVNRSNLEDEIDNKKRILLIPAFKQISLLISNITNTDDHLTVITPPTFQNKKDKE
ncbi:MAG: hypothetical protein ACQEQF_09985 [Bacillota bacterium]